MDDRGANDGKDERKSKALQVAYLVTQKPDISQNEIKTRLGLSGQSEVSKLLSLAKEKKWLRWQMVWPPDIDMNEIVNFVVARDFPELEELQASINNLGKDREGPAPRLSIIYDIGGETSEAERQAEFGLRAGEYIQPFIMKSKTCAVAWGRTIQSWIDGIGRVESGGDRQFIPMSGEPLNNRNKGLSSSAAAQKLSDCYSSECARPLSLVGVPARMPKDLAVPSDIIRRFVDRSDDYRAIFGGLDGGAKGLIAGVDMIVTGIGDIRTSADDPLFLELVAMEGGKDAKKFGEHIASFSNGNLGGVWLPKDRLNSEHRKEVDEINSRWLGVKEDHIRQCAKRADRDKAQGVFVLAFDKEKANILASAIGMINHMIITQSLAQALLAELRKILV